MQSDLIVLLLFVLLLALQGWYFGYYRPVRPLAWLQQSTLVVALCLLTPVLLYTLWSQVQAKGRLTETGFLLHPAIGASVGIATGPVWVFEVHAPWDEIERYYRQPQHHPGWQLVAAEPLLIFRREQERMSIAYHQKRLDSTLIFTRSSD